MGRPVLLPTRPVAMAPTSPATPGAGGVQRDGAVANATPSLGGNGGAGGAPVAQGAAAHVTAGVEPHSTAVEAAAALAQSDVTASAAAFAGAAAAASSVAAVAAATASAAVAAAAATALAAQFPRSDVSPWLGLANDGAPWASARLLTWLGPRATRRLHAQAKMALAAARGERTPRRDGPSSGGVVSGLLQLLSGGGARRSISSSGGRAQPQPPPLLQQLQHALSVGVGMLALPLMASMQQQLLGQLQGQLLQGQQQQQQQLLHPGAGGVVGGGGGWPPLPPVGGTVASPMPGGGGALYTPLLPGASPTVLPHKRQDGARRLSVRFDGDDAAAAAESAHTVASMGYPRSESAHTVAAAPDTPASALQQQQQPVLLLPRPPRLPRVTLELPVQAAAEMAEERDDMGVVVEQAACAASEVAATTSSALRSGGCDRPVLVTAAAVAGGGTCVDPTDPVHGLGRCFLTAGPAPQPPAWGAPQVGGGWELARVASCAVEWRVPAPSAVSVWASARVAAPPSLEQLEAAPGGSSARRQRRRHVQLAVVGFDNGTISALDAGTGAQLLPTLLVGRGPVKFVSLLATASEASPPPLLLLLAATCDGALRVWRLEPHPQQRHDASAPAAGGESSGVAATAGAAAAAAASAAGGGVGGGGGGGFRALHELALSLGDVLASARASLAPHAAVASVALGAHPAAGGGGGSGSAVRPVVRVGVHAAAGPLGGGARTASYVYDVDAHAWEAVP